MSDIHGALVVSDNPYVLVERHIQTETPIISVSGMGVEDILVACSFLIEMFMEQTGEELGDVLDALKDITYDGEPRGVQA